MDGVTSQWDCGTQSVFILLVCFATLDLDARRKGGIPIQEFKTGDRVQLSLQGPVRRVGAL